MNYLENYELVLRKTEFLMNKKFLLCFTFYRGLFGGQQHTRTLERLSRNIR